MIQLPEDFDSIFRYIVVVSQRAEQLINGAKPRSESRHAKPTLVAKTDVDSGEVPWRVLTQEELDARRQEIVEQFRAEVSGAEGAVEGDAQIPDVLPTAGAEAAADGSAAAADGEERDDELSRLQRLLGMAAGDVDEDHDQDTADAEGEKEAGAVEEAAEEATEVPLDEVEALEEGKDDTEEEE